MAIRNPSIIFCNGFVDYIYVYYVVYLKVFKNAVFPALLDNCYYMQSLIKKNFNRITLVCRLHKCILFGIFKGVLKYIYSCFTRQVLLYAELDKKKLQ